MPAKITAARIAFGGMAGILRRVGASRPLCLGRTVERLIPSPPPCPAFGLDFQPLSDMPRRASAAYRLLTAQNLLTRYFHDLAGTPVNVLEVQP